MKRCLSPSGFENLEEDMKLSLRPLRLCGEAGFQLFNSKLKTKNSILLRYLLAPECLVFAN